MKSGDLPFWEIPEACPNLAILLLHSLLETSQMCQILGTPVLEGSRGLSEKRNLITTLFTRNVTKLSNPGDPPFGGSPTASRGAPPLLLPCYGYPRAHMCCFCTPNPLFRLIHSLHQIFKGGCTKSDRKHTKYNPGSGVCFRRKVPCDGGPGLLNHPAMVYIHTKGFKDTSQDS